MWSVCSKSKSRNGREYLRCAESGTFDQPISQVPTPATDEDRAIQVMSLLLIDLLFFAPVIF